MTFQDLGLIEPILRAVKDQGYTNPTPIQEQSIPILLEGNDLLGCAQTGTGKTAAFAIPIIQLLEQNRNKNEKRKVKALVVTPTRELAIQIADSFTDYSKYTSLKNTVIFGGVKQGKQTDALRRGVDILIATPGRLLDLINQGFISLSDVEYSVLDEADQMLDMGFIHDIKKIIRKLPAKRQSLFFSATMAPAIVELSGKLLGSHPQKVTIKPEQATAERVEQAVYHVIKHSKPKLLIHLLEAEPEATVLVFSRTKHGADKIVRRLDKAKIKAEAIHGNKSQGARQRALGNFKDGSTRVLVATDIAARGIDVSELSLVINYDLPNVPETYVHRIGRTGRANASGVALSFCDKEERAYLKDIQKLIKQEILVIEDHPFVDDVAPPKDPNAPQHRGGRQNNGRNNNNSNNSNRGGNKNSNNSWRGRKPKSRSHQR